jgi:hypothetical protein
VDLDKKISSKTADPIGDTHRRATSSIFISNPTFSAPTESDSPQEMANDDTEELTVPSSPTPSGGYLDVSGTAVSGPVTSADVSAFGFDQDEVPAAKGSRSEKSAVLPMVDSCESDVDAPLPFGASIPASVVSTTTTHTASTRCAYCRDGKTDLQCRLAPVPGSAWCSAHGCPACGCSAKSSKDETCEACSIDFNGGMAMLEPSLPGYDAPPLPKYDASPDGNVGRTVDEIFSI